MQINIGKPPHREGEIDNPEFFMFGSQQIDKFHAHNARVERDRLDKIKQDKRAKREIEGSTIVVWCVIMVILAIVFGIK